MDMSMFYEFFPGFPNTVIDVVGLMLVMFGLLVCIGFPWIILSFFINNPRTEKTATSVLLLFTSITYVVFLIQYIKMTLIISLILSLIGYVLWWYGSTDKIKKHKPKDIDLFE